MAWPSLKTTWYPGPHEQLPVLRICQDLRNGSLGITSLKSGMVKSAMKMASFSHGSSVAAGS
jgi:hypothetical protein